MRTAAGPRARTPASHTGAGATLPEVIPTTDTGRALPIMWEVPPGCSIWPMLDHRHDPHLKAGEYAVVDTTDRKLVWGELFMTMGCGVCRPEIWHVRRHTEFKPDCTLVGGGEAVWFVSLTTDPRHKVGDGPMKIDAFEARILGRVVGIYEPEWNRPSAGGRS